MTPTVYLLIAELPLIAIVGLSSLLHIVRVRRRLILCLFLTLVLLRMDQAVSLLETVTECIQEVSPRQYQFLCRAATQSSCLSLEESDTSMQIHILSTQHLSLHKLTHCSLVFLNLLLDPRISTRHHTLILPAHWFLFIWWAQSTLSILVQLEQFPYGSNLILHGVSGKFVIKIHIPRDLLLQLQSLQPAQLFLAGLSKFPARHGDDGLVVVP
jgi:hypothetical protein